MKASYLRVIAAVLMIGALCPAQGQGIGLPDEDRAAIRDVIERTQEYNNSGDVGKWVGLFAEDAVYMPPGVPAVTTREALVETARAGFRHQASIAIEPIEIVVEGDLAFARTEVTGTVDVFGSDEVVNVDGKQIVIYTRGPDGQWKISRLINNSNTQ